MPDFRSRVTGVSALFAALLACLAACLAFGAESGNPFVHPPQLEPDVRFWIRVYTEVTTDQGLLHDDWNLGLVYEVLRFDPCDLASRNANDASSRPRRAMRRCCGVLRRAIPTI